MIKFDSKNLENKMDLLKKWFETQFTQDALVEGCNDLAAKIDHRVVQKGQKATGGTFGTYSTKPILVSPKSFERKSSWTEVLKKVKASENSETGAHWVTIKRDGETYRLVVLPGGYKEVRRLDGHLNTNKNFNRTTRMWRNFGVKPEKTRPFNVFIGGTNEESQLKINWNTKREGVNIIDASTQEEKMLTNYVNQVVQRKIKQYFA